MILEILIFLVTVVGAYLVYSQYRLEQHFKGRDVKMVKGVPMFGNFFKSTFRKRHFLDDVDEVYKAFPEERFEESKTMNENNISSDETSAALLGREIHFQVFSFRQLAEVYVGLVEATTPIVLIRDPELIKQITVKDFDHFTDHRQFFTEDQDPLFGGSLLMLKGDKWKDMRATLSPAFTSSKMRQMVPFIDDISKNVINYVTESIKRGNGKVSDDIHVDDLIRRYTNDVILSSAFGLQVNSLKDKDNEFYLAGQALTNFSTWQRIHMFFVISFPFIAKMFGMNIFPKKVTALFANVVTETMAYREKNNIDRPDMIQLLMEASKGTLKLNRDRDEEKDDVGFATTQEMLVRDETKIRHWSLNELAGQGFVFYFAGYESSASVLVFTIHELVLQPKIQEKLYAEAKEVQDKHKTVSYELIQELKYLDMVINETFRKWSPALIMDRECIKPYVLPPAHPGGKPYKVEKGYVVYNTVNSVHMDEKHFPEPQKFDPERFSDENKKNIKPFTFMPFGVGPRNCIGSRFALLELKILMYNLILNFEIVKCSKTVERIELQPLDFNIKLVGDSWVKLKARQ